MLKYLAILAVLVILAIASVGFLEGQSAPLSSPKERVAKTDSGQNTKQQPETDQHKNAPINLTSADVEMVSTPCDEACQQGRRNLEIQGKLEWFTGLLAIVGVLQVGTMIWQAILLRQTRGDVHRQAEWMETQAGHMESQTKILGESVAVAQTSADAANAQIRTVKDKERARIQVTAVDFSTVYLDENVTNHMIIEFLNLGPTHAFNVRAEGDGWFSVKGFDMQEVELTDLVLPTVLRANIPETSWVPLYFNGEAGEEVRNMKAKTQIEMMGSVEYSDVFGDNHKTAFHYRMFVYGWEKDVAPNKSFKMKRMGGWRKTGPPEDNHAS